jgi:hypothetical protein
MLSAKISMEPTENKKSDPGVFLVKGDKVSIPSFSISIDEQGNLHTDPVALHTGIDMSPYWLNIAFGHLKATERAHKRLMQAKATGDDNLIGENLKKESASGMQTIMASGIATDAYYASIKEHVTIPQNTIDAWQANGTARYKQIAETMRVGFHLSNASGKNLRDALKQNLSLRDMAVHPKAGTTSPQHHVELNKITDWRYATFRFHNAKTIYGLTLSIIFQTASKLSPKVSNELATQCNKLTATLKPILRKWERKYGKLT